MKRRKRAALCVVLSGAVTVVSIILMRMAAGPALPPYTLGNADGFKSSMVWFELATTREEIFENLGPFNSPEGQALRKQIDTTNYYDFGFMVCYSLFNASLIYFVTHLNLYRFRGLLKLRVFMALGLILSCAMLLGDFLENQQLLDLSKVHEPGGVLLSTLTALVYWTRVKWGAIFVTALMLCAGYTAYFRRIPTLMIPALYAVAGVSGLAAISLPSARPVLESISVPAITFAWVSSLCHAGVVWVRGPAAFPLPANHTPRTAPEAAPQLEG